jgi:hypothetical protein
MEPVFADILECFRAHLPLLHLQLNFSWSSGTSMSMHTVIDLFQFLRDICGGKLLENPVQLGGIDATGAGIICEIDESCLCMALNRPLHLFQYDSMCWVCTPVPGSTKFKE